MVRPGGDRSLSAGGKWPHPPEVLSAILLLAVVLVDGSRAIPPANHQLVKTIAATIVAWRLCNTWLTIGSGLLVLWFLTLV